MKTALAGVGGIGSNVALHLVRSTSCALRLIDYDRVEPSNLNRQFYFHDQIGRYKVDMLSENLLRINPDARLETVRDKIHRDNLHLLLDGCDLIVEGFDKAEDKKMLIEWGSRNRIPVVSANGIAGPNLTKVTCRTFGSCYVVGDFTTDCRDAGLFSHKVSHIAAHMAAKAVSLLTEGKYDDE